MTASKYRLHQAGTLNSSFEVGMRKLVLDASGLTQQRTLRFPDANGASGQLLSTDGAGNLSYVTRVTSVAASGGSTGLTVSGGPITTTGTLTLGGTLAIASGGTGQTTANAALNVLLPSQPGNSQRVLTSNGTNTNWVLPERVYTSAGLVTGPKTFVGNAVSNGSGVWTVSITAAGFTTITGVSVVCANAGTTATTQPWATILSATTVSISGYIVRPVNAVVLAGAPTQFVASGTVYVTVHGT